ncbi:Ig-like domain-containing protein [Anaeromicropila herbilytica]|uniref:F5/8 type C domain-containing protein n=1 Tax=Anaeromicropila herbilytica TaxID=2785025 RepID=A0A7R7EJU3_9FIRM|nr:Ig-like domain-containing protein [Anaeromicropila herbilytica]BCN30059.1 hypothetical protein bsdtb5_13540 [Anaeromicropila herbilytica]
MNKKKFGKKLTSLFLVGCITLTNLNITNVQANYTTSFVHKGKGTDYGKPTWNSNNTFAAEGLDYSDKMVSNMLKSIDIKDKSSLLTDSNNLPWMDKLLGNKGVIPDDNSDDSSANTLFSRGSALYLKSQDPSQLGFVGEVCYADTLGKSSMFSVDLSGQNLTESKELRNNYPSHENQTWTSTNLKVNQRKFITANNTAVALLDINNTTNKSITFDIAVSSPFITKSNGSELVGEKVACPLMVGTGVLNAYVEAMSYVDVHLTGNEMIPIGNSLKRTITLAAGQSINEKIVMGWIANEIPDSQTDYDKYTGFNDNETAFKQQVIDYNAWWSENIPYIDIPDNNIKKVLYYRWWCNRFNLLDANIPGNDWQFPMNMEGVLGYNNGITVSVAWAMQDLKWLRDPSYVYGTWLSQGEYSKGTNYKNNPGRPNTWTWDMMQNISQVGYDAYKIHGGGSKLLSKFANMSKDDVYGTLSTFSVNNTKYDNDNLVFYNHGPMTGNDGDTVSMHYNNGGSFARIDGSSTNYANAYATAKMYEALGDTNNANQLYSKASDIRAAFLKDLWFDGNDFDKDGKADTLGSGSFLHRQASTGELVPWRDNNLFAFSFGVVPKAGENGYNAKYLTQLKDYGDPNYYPIFPFFTADQTSIEKRIKAWINGTASAYGTNQFAFCNFGNYINVIRASMRYYPVSNIDVNTYQTLLDWGAWLHTVEPGNTDYLDSNEFFWLTNYFFGTNWTKTNPPRSTGNMVRSWIHHDTLGMMDYTTIEDMAGLQAREDDKIELWPLGVNYNYFTVDNIKYHNKDLSIVWQDPKKEAHYSGIPKGFSLYINGERMMTVDQMSHLIFDPQTGKVSFPKDVTGAAGNNSNTKVLYEKGTSTSFTSAVNTSLADNTKLVDCMNEAGVDIVHDGTNLVTRSMTKITATGINANSGIMNLANGDTAVSDNEDSNIKNNVTSFAGSNNKTDTILFDFGSKELMDNVKIYFYNNRLKNGYDAPNDYQIMYQTDKGEWKNIVGQIRTPSIAKSNYNNVEFVPVQTRYLKVLITHKQDYSTGITELQIYNNNLGIVPRDNIAPVIQAIPTNISTSVDTKLTINPVVTDDGLPKGELNFGWKVIKKPSETAVVSISNATERNPEFIFGTPGEYTLELTVNDGALSTKVTIPIKVYLNTSYLTEMIAKYSGTEYLKLNTSDYEKESWNRLVIAMNAAKDMLSKGGYTEAEVNAATNSMKDAISNLRYVNIALLATPSTNYCSSWEKLSSVNDGYIPLSPAKDESKGCYAYGNWGGSADSYQVEYTWEDEVTITGASTYFYNDQGGIGLPKAYVYQYYDEQKGAFVDVSNASKYSYTNGAFNDVNFDQVKTKRFRINMTKASSSVWNGIKEFRVIGTAKNNVQKGNIVSLENTSVNTIINQYPTMPSTVMATYENGTTSSIPVTWETISANKLSTATNFNVTGTVEGTTITAICHVYVKYDKSKLKNLIETADTMKQTDYPNVSKEMWSSFLESLQTAKDCFNNEASTEGDISNAVKSLEDAMNVLASTSSTRSNIAIKAIATSSYTSSWNTVNAVNDGKISLNNKSNVTPDGSQTSVYGNWGSNDNQSVTLTWENEKTLYTSSILFYDDREGNSAYHGETIDQWSGVGIPITYTYEYLDNDGKWVKISSIDENGAKVDTMNQTIFQTPIKTKALRITMVRNKLATGIIEWIVEGE